MTSDGAGVDLDRVLAEIRETVAENTATGVYSETLEDELRSHFARLLDRQDIDRFNAVWTAVDDLEALRSLPGQPKHTGSRVPGGELVHRATGRLLDRQLAGVADRSDLMWQATILALRSIASVLDQPTSHTHADLLHEIDTLQDRLAALERVVGRADGRFEKIDATMETPDGEATGPQRPRDDRAELRASMRPIAFAPTYSSVAFDEMSRGDRDRIRAEYEGLADRLVGVPGPVLDIGAGRGELLELLTERGVRARGVDIDPELVAATRALGLDVHEGPGADALAVAGHGSLGAVTLIHVIEHLHPNELLEMVDLAHDKLAPGGRLVLETPNPQSLYTHARAFWLDPTHLRPVHPAYLEFVLRERGFEEVDTEWIAFPPDDELMQPIPGEGDARDSANENFRRLNQLVFAAQNYRITAMR